MASSPPILRAEALALSRSEDDAPVLEGVDFELHAGECVSIEGPTGSGKSTLLRALAGMSGVETRAGRLERTRAATLLAQHVEVQLLCTTVGEEVGLGLAQHGVAPVVARVRAAAALEAVGLAGFEHREIDRLSAGQKQRTLLAALLALEPAALLLDEPTSALDEQARRALARTLQGLKQRGAAIVIVHHGAAELEPAFDRHLVIEKRSLVQRSTGPRERADRGARADDGAGAAARAGRSRPRPAEIVVAAEAAGRDRAGRLADLPIRAGERVLVTGRNGSGKSTWLRTVAELAHAARTRAGNRGRARESTGPGDVALVIQEPRRALFARTAADEIAFGLVRRGWPRAQREARVEALLARFDLLGCAGRSPLRLSFGQQHRLAIAAALAARPSLALLDEPFAGLDGDGRRALLRILSEEQDESNAAFVLASHDRSPLADWCDRSVELTGEDAADA